jgi:LPS-assembly lipoprotein
MSSYRIISLFLVLLLHGCGFQPLYGKNNHENLAGSSRIFINPIPSRRGQILRNNLSFTLNPKGHTLKPIYTLNIQIEENTTSLAVRKNAIATRANLTLRAKFNLNSIQDEKLLFSGNYSITVSYNILDNEYATLAAEKNAAERGLLATSQGIRTQLGSYFSRINN